MSVSDISLTSGMRANLLNLQSTVNLINRTQTRLTTGKKVNSAIDDPTNYFTARDHLNRASDLASRKDGMGEAIQTFRASTAGIDGITSLLEAAKGLTASARSANTVGRSTLAAQFDIILAQIDTLASDSGYKGINLLTGGNLTVDFNEDGSNQLIVTGFDASSGGLGINAALTEGTTSTTTNNNPAPDWADLLPEPGGPLVGGPYTSGQSFLSPPGDLNAFQKAMIDMDPTKFRLVDSTSGGIAIVTGTSGFSATATVTSGAFTSGDSLTLEYYSDAGVNQTTGAPNPVTTTTTTPGSNTWETTGGIDASLTEVQNAMNALRSQSAGLSASLGIVTTREDFTNEMINTLQSGADNLTLADMNQEGANMLMLQTKQSLGTTALSLASQAAQSVLRLF